MEAKGWIDMKLEFLTVLILVKSRYKKCDDKEKLLIFALHIKRMCIWCTAPFLTLKGTHLSIFLRSNNILEVAIFASP